MRKKEKRGEKEGKKRKGRGKEKKADWLKCYNGRAASFI